MKRLLTGALALSLLTGTAAMAQPYGHDRDHRNGQEGYNQDRDHGYNRGDGRHDNGHHWGRGQRLPREYYQARSRYVDYRPSPLRGPPSGSRWVRPDDNNSAMVAIASGLIPSITAATR